MSHRLSRRSFLKTAAAAPMLGLLPTAYADAPDLSKVTLRVGDQTGSTRGLLQAAGLLKDVPYRIDWAIFPAAAPLHEALKANAIDIGGSNDSPAVNAIAGGAPNLIVTAWHNPGSTETSLLTQKDSPIKTLADLRGKTISPTTRGSVSHFLVANLLKKAGIRPDEVKLAFLSPTDAAAAFSSGNIDAWATWTIFKARAIGSLGARVVDDGAGINSGLFVLAAHPEAVRDPGKLAAITHFSRLQEAGNAWGRANRKAYVDWYSGFSKQDPAVIEQIYNDNVNYQRQPVVGEVSKLISATYDTWVDIGLLKPGADLNSHFFSGVPL